MRSSGGFTLTELIMVIVITGIIATVSVQFISFSTRGAMDTASRQQMANAGSVVATQVSRALRNALPGSIRVTDDHQCVEYIPVLAASTYQDLPVNAEGDSFTAVAWSGEQDLSGRVAVYPLVAGQPYNLTHPSVISSPAEFPAGTGEVEVTLSQGHRFLTHSPNRRFFLVDDPRAICAQDRYLYRYKSYGWLADASEASDFLAGGEREVLAMPLEPGSMEFEYQPPSLQRNGVVSFRYVLTSQNGEEQLPMRQEVQIRNVP